MSDEIKGAVEPHTIPLELFSRRSNKTTRLIENLSDEKSLDGRNRWYSFQLDEPIYAKEISVTAEGYSNWDEVEFEIINLDTTQHEEKVKFESDTSSISLGKLITGFRFKPDAKWLSDTKIKKVSVLGRVDKRDSHQALSMIQAGICDGDQLGTRPYVGRGMDVL